MRHLLGLLAILALAVPTMGFEEPRFTHREYGYVVVESNWVLEVKVELWEPWVPGRFAEIDVVFEVKEAVENSILSIVSVTASTGSVSTSSYVGIFKRAGDRRSISLSLELSEPRYTKLKPGDHVIEFLSLSIRGYVENLTGRSFFSRNLLIPVLLASPSGALRLSIDSTTSIRVGTETLLNVLISNRGANTIYHVEVSFYANETLLDVAYYPWIEAGSSKYIYLQFKPTKSGAYIITAKVRYITQEYGVQNLTYQTLVYAKTQHFLSIALANTGKETWLVGVVSPATNTTVYIEASSDGLSWAPLAIITPRVDGVFTIPIKTEKEKRILLRARIPDTEKTFESTSNVEVLENTSQTLRETPFEARTVTHIVTQTVVQTVHVPVALNRTQGEQLGPRTLSIPLSLVTGILVLGVTVGSILLILFRRSLPPRP